MARQKDEDENQVIPQTQELGEAMFNSYFCNLEINRTKNVEKIKRAINDGSAETINVISELFATILMYVFSPLCFRPKCYIYG